MGLSSISLKSYVHNLQLPEVCPSFFRDGYGNMSTLWMSCMDMVETMPGMLRALREDNRYCIGVNTDMIQWCFDYYSIYYV